jgi:multicomponent Na+:H+ antiporter subunit D
MTWATPECLLVAAILIPLVAAALIPLFQRWPNVRETVTLVAAVLLCLAVVALLGPVLAGGRPQWTGIEVFPGVAFAFRVEPLGMLFALVASSLWIVNSTYSIGYMRANKEPRQTGYYVCFAIALASTMGIAFAENLFTLFLAYEALTLSTYPLVTHHRDAKAMASGRLYLLLLLGTSMVLLLPAIVATYVLAGTIDFSPGGVLGGKAGDVTLVFLLVLYVFGIGKAAMMPLHFWLPAAMVAPTPVSALLHAVAVVKAGVFCVVKVVVYIFGLETLTASGANEWLIYAASASLLGASLIALTRDNLKARLAYSTVSQLAYVVLGAALATTTSIVGSGVHIAMHAAGKITLFFCAGAIYVAAHKTEVSELNGIGRRMPVTMIAFLVGSLSIIGIPPLGGAWSKWLLSIGAIESGHLFVIGVLMLSSLLNVGYLLSIVGRAFFLPLPKEPPGHEHGHDHGNKHGNDIQEAPLACLIPLCVTALLCVVLFFQVDQIQALLSAIVTAPASPPER